MTDALTTTGPTPTTSGVFRGYVDPQGHFARRLALVQQVVGETLESMRPGPIVVVDICGGEGRALLPVIARHPRARDIRAYVIDVDRESVLSARASASRLQPGDVTVIEADAGVSSAFAGVPRADLVILSGVLAHLSNDDRTRLVGFLPEVCAPDARLVWTIGTRINAVRTIVARGGFDVEARHAVLRWKWGGGVKHEIGVARLAIPPRTFVAGRRIFAFRVPLSRRFPRIRRVLQPLVQPYRRIKGLFRSA